MPRHTSQAHPEGGEAKHPQPTGKWGRRADAVAGSEEDEEDDLLDGSPQGGLWIKEGVVAPIQCLVLWSCTDAGSPQER